MSGPVTGPGAGRRENGETAISISGSLLTMFWIAQAVSLFGARLNNFSLVALVNRFSDDPSLQLSGIYAAMYLPVLLLAPVAGVIVDRLSKRWVLAGTDLARGLLVLLIPVAFGATGSFIPVMGVVFLVAAGNLLFLPAKSALLPEIVPAGKLVKVNSILWIAGIAGVAGGFLGGSLIFDNLSWAACFYLDGATYLVSALLLTVIALRLAKSPNGAGAAKNGEGGRPGIDRGGEGFMRSLAGGFAELRSNRSLIPPPGVQSLIFFGAGGLSVLALVLIQDVSGQESSMGLAAAGLSAGAGMAIGSLLAHRMGSGAGRPSEAALFVLFAPAAAAVAPSGTLALVCAGMLLAGLAATPLYGISEARLQARISPELRGRIFSVREVATRSLFLLSSFMMSFLGASAGKGPVLLILGSFLAICGVVWAVSAPEGRTRTNNDGSNR